jgi:hypothetical protein
MPKATCVHSTPPTNTPIERRRFLTVAAGASVASVGALTVAAMPATAPDRQACAVDPIFAIIDKHQAATATWREAVNVEFAYEKCGPEVEALDPVERQTYQSTFDSLQEATSDAGDQMRETSIDLVNTPPASLAGIVALCEYIGPQLDDDERHLPDEIEWDDGTQSTPAGAFANVIRSAVAAMVKS